METTDLRDEAAPLDTREELKRLRLQIIMLHCMVRALMVKAIHPVSRPAFMKEAFKDYAESCRQYVIDCDKHSISYNDDCSKKEETKQ